MPPSSKPLRGRGKADRPIPGKRPIVPYFDPDLFRDALGGLGLWFNWSRAVLCPCRLGSGSDQVDPNCTICGSDGWWYTNPDAETETQQTALYRNYLKIKCAFSSAHLDPKFAETFGRYGFGEATLSVANTARVGAHDRFVGLEQEMIWTELLVRDMSLPYVAVGKGRRSTEMQLTTLRYEPVRVEFVAIADGTRFYEGHDWVLTEPTLTEPARMQWLEDKGPEDGALYTVSYVCRPTWLVDSANYAVQHLRGPEHGIRGNVDRVQELPTTFLIRLDYLPQQMGS